MCKYQEKADKQTNEQKPETVRLVQLSQWYSATGRKKNIQLGLAAGIYAQVVDIPIGLAESGWIVVHV